MFELTESQRMLRTAVRDWAEKELAPLVDEAEEKEEFPKQVLPQLGKLGYLGLGVPEEDGGSGGGIVEQIIFKEEIARVCAGIAQGITGPPPSLLIAGTKEQKAKYLGPAMAGEKIWGYGLTEPEAGSDAASIQTVAKKDGDNYILNGHKQFTTNGDICDGLEVYAYTDKSMGAKGISLFLFETDTPGFTVVKKMNKVGLHSAQTAEEVFEDVVVPKENLVGEEGRGFILAMQTLESGRMIYASYSLGIAQAALEASISYAKERVQFGQPIGKFQAISHKIADMATMVEAGRSLLYKAAWLYDQGQRRTTLPYMAKLYCSEMAVKVTGDAVQIHGGYGLMSEHPVQRYFRDARMFTILMGTSEIQRLTISRTLGL
jgi:butyryl-CoA dehydrogenase